MDSEIRCGQYPHTGALTRFMSCEMNRGYLTLTARLQWHFSTLFFIILTAGGSLGIDK